MNRKANCHPDRPYHALNLCLQCYGGMAARRQRSPGYKPGPINQVNICGHPKRPHKAKGMCNACYRRSMYEAHPRVRVVPEVTCGHVDVPHKAHGLCVRCYDRQHRNRRRASCHTDRAHHAKGLCESCYRGLQNRVRDKRLAGSVHHTESEWRRLLGIYPVCPRCRKPWDKIGAPTRDHIKSVVNGGDDSIENIQPLCLFCNSQKQHKSEFYPLGGVPWAKQRLFIVSATNSMCI